MATRLLLPLAQHGNPQAQTYVGFMFQNGRGLPQNYVAAADWYRLFLGEVYLQILERNERVPLPTLLRNLPALLNAMTTASSRVRAMMKQVLANPRFHPAGHMAGRAQMILGLLYKIKGKPAAAQQHLSDAHVRHHHEGGKNQRPTVAQQRPGRAAGAVPAAPG